MLLAAGSTGQVQHGGWTGRGQRLRLLVRQPVPVHMLPQTPRGPHREQVRDGVGETGEYRTCRRHGQPGREHVHVAFEFQSTKCIVTNVMVF